MISKKYRLKKTDIERIYKKGTRKFQQPFLVRILTNRTTHNRYAVVIPKAVVAKAVDRNRLRRLIYDFIYKANLQGNTDYIISLKQKTDEAGIDKTLKIVFSGVK